MAAETTIDNGDQRTFKSVLRNIRKRYPAKAAEGISLSMTFIALLHICNEEGLKLEGSADMRDFSITQDLTVEKIEMPSL